MQYALIFSDLQLILAPMGVQRLDHLWRVAMDGVIGLVPTTTRPPCTDVG